MRAANTVAASIGIGIVLWVVVGFGGCVVRIVTNSGDWIGGNSPSSVWVSYTREAVLAFLFAVGIGIYSAVKILRK